MFFRTAIAMSVEGKTCFVSFKTLPSCSPFWNIRALMAGSPLVFEWPTHYISVGLASYLSQSWRFCSSVAHQMTSFHLPVPEYLHIEKIQFILNYFFMSSDGLDTRLILHKYYLMYFPWQPEKDTSRCEESEAWRSEMTQYLWEEGFEPKSV